MKGEWGGGRGAGSARTAGRRCWRCTTWSCTTASSGPWMQSRCGCSPARSTRSSAPTVRASRHCCARSPACTPPPRARSFSTAQDVTRVRPERRATRGIVMVPEGRRLFESLSVEENLKVGATYSRQGPWTIERVYEMFGWMRERRNQPTAQLSGGEQQTVAIGRALVANPRVLLLDELSLGLAPVVVQRIYGMLPQILATGLTVLLVEQDVSQALRVASHIHCLLEGRTTLVGTPASISADQVEAAYFGLADTAPGQPARRRGVSRHGLGKRHHPGGAGRRALRAVRLRTVVDVRGDEGREPGARRPRGGGRLRRDRRHHRHPHPGALVLRHRGPADGGARLRAAAHHPAGRARPQRARHADGHLRPVGGHRERPAPVLHRQQPRRSAPGCPW